MKLRPMFKCFGSKWSGAVRYPEPQWTHIVEPFAGGAGYALNYADLDVTIWDIHPVVGVLWEWLINEATSQEILDIPVAVPVGTDIRTLGLSDGQARLMQSWQRTNGRLCWTVSVWNNMPGLWCANTRARVADQVNGIKHWRFEPPPWTAGACATWYIDPPYQYNDKYNCPVLNYTDLGAKVRGLHSTAQVIVCEAPCPKTGAVPDWLPFSESHSQVNARRGTRPELVYYRASGAPNPTEALL